MLGQDFSHERPVLVKRCQHSSPLSVVLWGDQADVRNWLLHTIQQRHNCTVFKLLDKFDELGLGHDDFVAGLDKVMLQVVHDEVYCDSILLRHQLGASPGHDNIGVLHRRLHEFDKSWLDEAVVGLEDAFYSSSSLDDVALETARQPNVVVRVHEDFQVEHLIDLLVEQAEYAFEDDQWGPLL